MQLGLENKKQTTWAITLGVIAVLAVAYEFMPLFFGSSAAPSTGAPTAAAVSTRASARSGPRGKKVRAENLDPTLRLDLLASTEKTIYEGNGVNIFTSRPDVVIPQPGASGVTDAKKAEEEKIAYQTPVIPPPPQIPLKFFGFASKPGEPKKVFLSHGEDVFVAGEGEIVNRQYKVVRISPTSVEMQDMVNSGPPQSIPLTQG